MFKPKERYPIGIDIGSRHVTAVQFQQTRQGLAVGELFYREVDNRPTDSTDTDDALIAVFKEIVKSKGFRGKSAAIHLPSEYVNNFPITFETGADETVEDAIARECRQKLSFPLEEAVIDYPSIVEVSSGKNRKFQAGIVAVRRDVIERYIHLLKRAGLSVEAIDFDLSSLLRLHNFLYSVKDDPVILCNVGQRRSLIAIVTQNNILALRNTFWGLQELMKRLETNLELSDNREQAAAMLAKYGLIYQDYISASGDLPAKANEGQEDSVEISRTLFQILTPYVDVLIHEFYQIVGYVRSRTPNVHFEEIFMYGQATAVNLLDQYIEKQLNIPTKSINPMLKLTRSDDRILSDTARGASFALALGLAMRKVTWL